MFGLDGALEQAQQIADSYKQILKQLMETLNETNRLLAEQNVIMEKYHGKTSRRSKTND